MRAFAGMLEQINETVISSRSCRSLWGSTSATTCLRELGSGLKKFVCPILLEGIPTAMLLYRRFPSFIPVRPGSGTPGAWGKPCRWWRRRGNQAISMAWVGGGFSLLGLPGAEKGSCMVLLGSISLLINTEQKSPLCSLNRRLGLSAVIQGFRYGGIDLSKKSKKRVWK